MLPGVPGEDSQAAEPTLATSEYLSLARDFKPPLEMYQPGSGVTIVVGALTKRFLLSHLSHLIHYDRIQWFELCIPF